MLGCSDHSGSCALNRSLGLVYFIRVSPKRRKPGNSRTRLRAVPFGSALFRLRYLLGFAQFGGGYFALVGEGTIGVLYDQFQLQRHAALGDCVENVVTAHNLGNGDFIRYAIIEGARERIRLNSSQV